MFKYFKFKLTNKDKLKVYTLALNYIKNENYKYMCLAINKALTNVYGIQIFGKTWIRHDVIKYPNKWKDFYSYKPIQTTHTIAELLGINRNYNVWFPIDIEGKQRRIEILTQLIESTKKLINK